MRFFSVSPLRLVDGYRDPQWAHQVIEFLYFFLSFTLFLTHSYALTTYLATAPEPPSHAELTGIENVPSLDQCWLQSINMLRSFADGSIAMGPELAESAIDRLQRCLLRQGNSVPSGMALLKCFDSVMMPLMLHYGTSDREKGYIIGVFISTLLASSETLALQPGFSSFWLRVIDVLCKFVSQGGGVGETTTERLKNLLLVMIVEKRFDTMSRVSEQNALEATMTMLDSYCPTIRVDLERMQKGEVPNETKRVNEQTASRTEAQRGETGKPSGEVESQAGEMEKPREETVDSSKESVETNPNEAIEVPIVEEKSNESNEVNESNEPNESNELNELNESNESNEPNESNESNESNEPNESSEGEAIAVVDEKEKENVAASEVFVEPSQSGESESVGSVQEDKTEEAVQSPEIPAEIIHVQDSE